MKRIAILSDTHGLLRDSVIAELAAADCSIHAGDINTPYLVESMRSLTETYVVRGNNDKDWAEALPKSITVTMEGVRFFIVHNKKDVPKNLTDVDVVVYGHSHKYFAEVINGVLFLNPGSCGKRRFDLELTMCRMTVDAGHYQFEKVMIPSDLKMQK
ncbi:MAG: putative hydrolase [Herbinix sp.]|nr:putative hydrolase [Herbinix sp.]